MRYLRLKSMSEDPLVDFVQQQDWLNPLADKSDQLVESAFDSTSERTKDVLVESRLLGHKHHPTVSDVPFGSWTVTLVSDVLEIAGAKVGDGAADTSIVVGLVASLVAAVGGLVDLSRTDLAEDRRLGTMHGILHGATVLLYGGSLAARRCERRGLGRTLSFAGYGTLIVASYLAGKLTESRQSMRPA